MAEARRNALRQAVAQLGAGLAIEVREHLLGRVQGWEERDRESCRRGDVHHGWSRVRLPRENLDALNEYVRGGDDQFKRGLEFFEQKRFAEALTWANRVSVQYPIGKQPLFRTERAWLLICDCHVELGQPRQAIRMCESLLAATDDPGFRQEAQARMASIRADYTNLLFRGAFGGRRVAVKCIVNLDGREDRWAKMQTEIEALVARAGGEIAGAGGSDLSPEEALFDAAAGARRAAVMRENDADGLVLFRAKGEIVRQAAGVHFSGAATGLVQMTGREPYVWEQRGPGGRTPLGAEMALDILALNVRRIWQADFAKQLEAP